ncbi:hypothetical protein HUJ05_000407 [Dendroctonus ponderosae]|nr:hypothetical protein HUJ05_000407 [Dendroctonus ponderosae]
MARLLRPSDMLFRYESRSKMPTCQQNRSYVNQVNNSPPPIDTPFKRKIDIFSQCVTVKSACCGLVAGHQEKHLRTRSTLSKLQWGFVGKLLRLIGGTKSAAGAKFALNFQRLLIIRLCRPVSSAGVISANKTPLRREEGQQTFAV